MSTVISDTTNAIGNLNIDQGSAFSVVTKLRPPTDTVSIQEFQKEVRHYIDTIDMPIVVGGTGLYIKGALYDYTFEETC